MAHSKSNLTLNITNIELDPFSKEASKELASKQMRYIQDGKKKTWDLVRRLDSIIVLVFNVSSKKLLFVEQFRPASYLSRLPIDISEIDCKKFPPNLGATIELCTARINEEKSITELAQNEVQKIFGYKVPLSGFQKVVTWR